MQAQAQSGPSEETHRAGGEEFAGGGRTRREKPQVFAEVYPHRHK